MAINIGSYLLLLLLHLPTHPSEVCRLLLNTSSYLLYQGAYNITMIVHAFCNIDDVSWGTKGALGSGERKYEKNKK